jgi:alpha-L-arabinofuranosidase
MTPSLTLNQPDLKDSLTHPLTIYGKFKGHVTTYTINGPDIKTENTFESPVGVQTRETALTANGNTLKYIFEPHSVNALVCDIG